MSYEDLIDHSGVEAADAKIAEIQARIDVAATSRRNAEAALAMANSASSKAIAAGGDGIAEEEAIAAAKIRLAAAAKVHSHAFTGLPEAKAEREKALTFTHRAVFWDGLKKRIAACAAVDAAKAAVAVAEEAHRQSDAQIRAAIAAKYPASFALAALDTSASKAVHGHILTAAEEAGMWAYQGYDHEKETFQGSKL